MKRKKRKEKPGKEIKTKKFKEERLVKQLKVTSVILGVLLVATFLFFAFSNNNPSSCSMEGVNAITDAQAKSIALKTVKGIVAPSVGVDVLNVKNTGSNFEVNLSLSASGKTQEYTSYLSLDGKYFYVSGIETSKFMQQPQTQSSSFDAPDSEKPKTMLFVMSFCPYGRQAEESLSPVVRMLGNKADFEVHYIVSKIGNGSFVSLHGQNELNEDVRQICISKNYDRTVYWDYVDYVNANCSLNTINDCWKQAAQAAGVNASMVQECANDNANAYLTAEEELVKQYGVSGSPTLFVNDALYSGGRTPEDFKQAVCSGFATQPSECSQNLSSSGAAASGNC